MNRSLPSLLATAVLAGEATVEGVTARVGRALGRNWKWIRPFARRYLKAYAGRVRPRHRDVARFLRADRGFVRASSKYGDKLVVAAWLTEPARMAPVEAAAGWDVPRIESVGELAAWLRLDASDLAWFADLRGLGQHGHGAPKLEHYFYRVLTKRSGAARLLEAPKPLLKGKQRAILGTILDRVPVHAAVHGFCRGRSIETFARLHLGRDVVLRMDVADFFPSISGARIQALFRTMGYPEPVADLLGGLCTNAAPRGVWRGGEAGRSMADLRELREIYGRPHLPQGAPTSPSLANLCFYRVDCRLAGLASAAGAEYTRYADDLAFSGGAEFARGVARFSLHVAAVLLEEGFRAHSRKTRVMRRGVRQALAGLVVNERVNVARDQFDRLKAILTNCVRLGAMSQNREGHPRFRLQLEGRVGFVEMVNRGRGRKLREILEKIDWGSS